MLLGRKVRTELGVLGPALAGAYVVGPGVTFSPNTNVLLVPTGMGER